jgi:hypothetical protein
MAEERMVFTADDAQALTAYKKILQAELKYQELLEKGHKRSVETSKMQADAADRAAKQKADKQATDEQRRAARDAEFKARELEREKNHQKRMEEVTTASAVREAEREANQKRRMEEQNTAYQLREEDREKRHQKRLEDLIIAEKQRTVEREKVLDEQRIRSQSAAIDAMSRKVIGYTAVIGAVTKAWGLAEEAASKHQEAQMTRGMSTTTERSAIVLKYAAQIGVSPEEADKDLSGMMRELGTSNIDDAYRLGNAAFSANYPKESRIAVAEFMGTKGMSSMAGDMVDAISKSGTGTDVKSVLTIMGQIYTAQNKIQADMLGLLQGLMISFPIGRGGGFSPATTIVDTSIGNQIAKNSLAGAERNQQINNELMVRTPKLLARVSGMSVNEWAEKYPDVESIKKQLALHVYNLIH